MKYLLLIAGVVVVVLLLVSLVRRFGDATQDKLAPLPNGRKRRRIPFFD